jgi:hypothetical protein
MGELPPRLFKPSPPPWIAYPRRRRPPPLAPRLARTLARARRRRRRIPPSSSFRRQGIAPEPRKEVSSVPVLHVVVPVHPAASCDLAGVRAPRRRVDRPRRRVSSRAATLDRFASSRTLRRCHPRLNPWLETLDQGPRRRVRRCPPPLTAAGLCSPAARRLRVSSAPDRDPTDRSKPRRRKQPQPLDPDPMDLNQPDPVN